MRYDRKLELALALGTVMGLASVAEAQAFVPDRAGREGPGFKVGRLVLHPGLSLEGGYDSNVFLENANPEDSFILRLTSYLDVATEPPIRQRQGEANAPAPQKIQFRGGLGASYYHYFFGRVPDNVGADAHIDFRYNPTETFSLQVRDKFSRTVQPFSNPNTIEGQTLSYGRNQNTAALDLVGRSKSQVLVGTLGYTNAINFFDSDAYAYGNNLSHRVPATLSWSFFPSSALVYFFDYVNQQYNQDRLATSPTLISDNNRVSTSLGYNGALTEKFSLTAAVGYAVGLYEIGDDFDGVTARLEARWRPRPSITVKTGYDRDYIPSFIGNFTLANRLHADASFVMLGALELGITTWVSFDKSGLAIAPGGTLLGNQPYREDTRFYAGLFGEYRFKAWISIFSQIGYLADFTNFQYSGAQPLIDPAGSYQRFDAWLGLRVFY